MKKLTLISIVLLASCQPKESNETKRLQRELDSIRIEKGKTIDTLLMLYDKKDEQSKGQPFIVE